MIWKDRIKQYPHRYTLTNVSGTTYDFEAVTGAVSEAGTPVNAENLNAVEAEIANRKIKDLAVRIKAKTPLNDRFDVKSWGGLTDFNGEDIWTDGANIYYSNGASQYVLNIATSTWSVKVWSGLTNFYGSDIWTDGINIYYSNGASQYVLNIATSTWSVKDWGGLTNFGGRYIWTDGANIYYSFDTTQYVLNIATSTWSVKVWSGFTNFGGRDIWTDGANIYFSFDTTQYVLDIATSTWSVKAWGGLTNFVGNYIWTDGVNIYYSSSANKYVLDIATSTWSVKAWGGLTNFVGNYIWTDGVNIYYSFDTTQYKFTPKKAISNWGNVQEIVPPYNPNLLINGDFAINQRGASSYTGNNTYTVDMWQLATADVTVDVLAKGAKLTIASSKVNGENYFLLQQKFENFADFSGKIVTATISYKNNTNPNTRINLRADTTNVYSGALSGASGTYSWAFTLPTITSSLALIITGNHTNGTAESVDIEYIKLEFGDTATPYIPPNRAIELAKCQRYLRFFKPVAGTLITVGTFWSGTTDRGFALFEIGSMRTTPTLSYSSLNDIVYSLGTTASSPFASVTFANISTDRSKYRAYCTGAFTAGLIYMVSVQSGGYLQFSAEIY